MEIETEEALRVLNTHKDAIIKFIGKEKYDNLVTLLESDDEMVTDSAIFQINNYMAAKNLEFETLVKKEGLNKAKEFIEECLITLLL